MAFKNSALLAMLSAVSVLGAPENFGLFGYGKGIGGLPLFYADGYAYLGQPSQSNSSDAAIVKFSPSTNNTWSAAPNSTESSFSNTTLYVPSPDASDKRVGFLPSNDTSGDEITTGFKFYGSTASLAGNDGLLQTIWYAEQVAESVYSLYWNDTSDGLLSVVLRRQAPSNPGN